MLCRTIYLLRHDLNIWKMISNTSALSYNRGVLPCWTQQPHCVWCHCHKLWPVALAWSPIVPIRRRSHPHGLFDFSTEALYCLHYLRFLSFYFVFTPPRPLLLHYLHFLIFVFLYTFSLPGASYCTQNKNRTLLQDSGVPCLGLGIRR